MDEFGVFINPPLDVQPATTDITFTGDWNVQRVGIDVVYDADAVNGQPVPSTLYEATFNGIGVNPMGGNNC